MERSRREIFHSLSNELFDHLTKNSSLEPYIVGVGLKKDGFVVLLKDDLPENVTDQLTLPQSWHGFSVSYEVTGEFSLMDFDQE